MTALAVLAAIGHVLILLEMIPAVEKHLVVGHRRRREPGQQRDHVGRANEEEFLSIESLGDIGDLHGHCP